MGALVRVQDRGCVLPVGGTVQNNRILFTWNAAGREENVGDTEKDGYSIKDSMPGPISGI
jgi:hypothetical protein